MSAMIMMPQQIDQAIKEMCADSMTQAVAVLAEKYGFDAEEANRFLDTTAIKIVRKRGPSPKTGTTIKTKTETADKKPKAKRAKTGYLLYGDEIRDEVRSALTSELEDDAKLKPQDVVKAIATRWKEEEQSVRDHWKGIAKDLAEYTPNYDETVDVE